MLASMIFRKEPFFHGQDNYDQVSSFSLCWFVTNAREIASGAGMRCGVLLSAHGLCKLTNCSELCVGMRAPTMQRQPMLSVVKVQDGSKK